MSPGPSGWTVTSQAGCSPSSVRWPPVAAGRRAPVTVPPVTSTTPSATVCAVSPSGSALKRIRPVNALSPSWRFGSPSNCAVRCILGVGGLATPLTPIWSE